MAETVVIDVIIESSQSATSLKELKQSLKDLKNAAVEAGEGTAEFDKLTKAAGAVKNQIDDLNASIKSSSGAPIQNVAGSFGLLGDKIKNLDFKGATTAAQGFAGTIKKFDFKALTSGVQGFGNVLGTVGKALLTNPIFLLVAIITAIIVAIVSLKDKVKIIGDAFAFFGDIIGSVVQALKDFTDLIGLTSFAVEEKAQKTIDAAKEEGDAIDKRYAREIKVAQAAGKDVKQLELEKATAVKDGIQKQLDAYAELAKAGVKLTDEQKTAVKELKDSFLDAQAEIDAANAAIAKSAEDAAKKIQEEADKKAKEAEDKRKAAALKQIEEKKNALKELDKIEKDALRDAQLTLEQDEIKKLELKRKFAEEDLKEKFAKFGNDKKVQEELNQTLLALETKFQADKKEIEAKEAEKQKEINDKKLKDEEDFNEKKKKLALQTAVDIAATETERATAEFEQKLANLESQFEGELQLTQEFLDAKKALEDGHQAELTEINKEASEERRANNQDALDASLGAAKGLADAVFAVQLAGVEKGSKKELEIRKKQFRVEKAFNVSRATIDGVRSVMAALTIPPPAGQILAIANGVTAAANIAKILAAKFDGGASGGGGGSASVPNVPSQTDSPPPGFRAPDFTTFGAGGGSRTGAQQPVKAFVVSEDITRAQDKDAIIQRRATF